MSKKNSSNKSDSEGTVGSRDPFSQLQQKLQKVASKKSGGNKAPEIHIGDDPDTAAQRFYDQLGIHDRERRTQIFHKVAKHLSALQYKRVQELQKELIDTQLKQQENKRDLERTQARSISELQTTLTATFTERIDVCQKIIDEYKEKLSVSQGALTNALQDYEHKMSKAESRLSADHAERMTKTESAFNSRIEDYKIKLKKFELRQNELIEGHKRTIESLEQAHMNEVEEKLSSAELRSTQKVLEYKTKLNEAATRFIEVKASKHDLEDRISDLERQLAEKERINKKEKEKNDVLVKGIEEQQLLIEKANAEAAAVEAMRIELTVQTNEVKQEAESRTQELLDLKEEHRKQIKSLEEENSVMKTRAIEARKTIEGYTVLGEEREKEISTLKSVIRREEQNQSLLKEEHQNELHTLKRSHTDIVRSIESNLRSTDEQLTQEIEARQALEVKAARDISELRRQKRALDDRLGELHNALTSKEEDLTRKHKEATRDLLEEAKQRRNEAVKDAVSTLQEQIKLQEEMARRNLEHQKTTFAEYEKQVAQTTKMEQSRMAQHMQHVKAIHSQTLKDIEADAKQKLSALESERDRHKNSSKEAAENHALIIKEFEDERSRHATLLRELTEHHRIEKNEVNEKLKIERKAYSETLAELREAHHDQMQEARSKMQEKYDADLLKVQLRLEGNKKLAVDALNEKLQVNLTHFDKELQEERAKHVASMKQNIVDQQNMTKTLYENFEAQLNEVKSKMEDTLRREKEKNDFDTTRLKSSHEEEMKTLMDEAKASWMNEIENMKCTINSNHATHEKEMQQLQSQHTVAQDEAKALWMKKMEDMKVTMDKSIENYTLIVDDLNQQVESTKSHYENLLISDRRRAEGEMERFKKEAEERLQNAQNEAERIRHDLSVCLEEDKEKELQEQMKRLEANKNAEMSSLLEAMDEFEKEKKSELEQLELKSQEETTKLTIDAKLKFHIGKLIKTWDGMLLTAFTRWTKLTLAERHNSQIAMAKVKMHLEHLVKSWNGMLKTSFTKWSRVTIVLRYQTKQNHFESKYKAKLAKKQSKMDELVKKTQGDVEELEIQNSMLEGETKMKIQIAKLIKTWDEMLGKAFSKWTRFTFFMRVHVEMDKEQTQMKAKLEELELQVEMTQGESKMKMQIEMLLKSWSEILKTAFIKWAKQTVLLRCQAAIKMKNSEAEKNAHDQRLMLAMTRVIHRMHAYVHEQKRRAIYQWRGRVYKEKLKLTGLVWKLRETTRNLKYSSFIKWQRRIANENANVRDIANRRMGTIFLRKSFNKLFYERINAAFRTWALASKVANTSEVLHHVKESMNALVMRRSFEKIAYKWLMRKQIWLRRSLVRWSHTALKLKQRDVAFKVLIGIVRGHNLCSMARGFRYLREKSLHIQTRSRLRALEVSLKQQLEKLKKKAKEDSHNSMLQLLKIKKDYLALSKRQCKNLEDVHSKAMKKVKVETAAALKTADIQAQKHKKEKDKFIKELKQLHSMDMMPSPRTKQIVAEAREGRKRRNSFSKISLSMLEQEEGKNEKKAAVPTRRLSLANKLHEKLKASTPKKRLSVNIATMSENTTGTHYKTLSTPPSWVTRNISTSRAKPENVSIDNKPQGAADRLALFKRRKSTIKHASLRSTVAALGQAAPKAD